MSQQDIGKMSMQAGGDNTAQVEARYGQYVLPTYSPGLLLVRGAGPRVWDADGREYLDFAVGISVCNLGHCHPAVTAAICEQAGRLVHVSNLYRNEVQPRLAEALIAHSFDGAVFFGNSGAEANEGMIKFARKWGSTRGRHEIIAMEDSFHGRTLATLAATGRSKYRQGFAPDMPGFRHVPFNDLGALAAAVNEQTCAVLLEPVQGEGGVIPASAEFMTGVRDLCDRHGLLMLCDEVQCGMGRTGTFLACQGYGVTPDAVSLAKALGNGFPIGAFIVRRPFTDVLGPGTHASTFGGTPLACAAAHAALAAMDAEDVLANCRRQGDRLRTRLAALSAAHPAVREVRGRGLMIGVAMDRPAAGLRQACQEAGLLVLTAGETVLRLLPPLTVTEAECTTAVAIIERSLTQIEKG
jgi:predicted acetylornithine/succinylornithine family transaminase